MAVPGRRPENVCVAIFAYLGHFRKTLSSRLLFLMFRTSLVGMWLHEIKTGRTGSCPIGNNTSCTGQINRNFSRSTEQVGTWKIMIQWRKVITAVVQGGCISQIYWSFIKDVMSM